MPPSISSNVSSGYCTMSSCTTRHEAGDYATRPIASDPKTDPTNKWGFLDRVESVDPLDKPLDSYSSEIYATLDDPHMVPACSKVILNSPNLRMHVGHVCRATDDRCALSRHSKSSKQTLPGAKNDAEIRSSESACVQSKDSRS